jgi:uncharacterized BrkB/YihY/UPF0761 family membrane protein
MKAWKFIVLAGGIIGLLGFFLPFMKFGVGNSGSVGVSGFALVKGLPEARELLASEIEKMPEEQIKKAAAELEDSAKKAGGLIMMFYIPTALVLLIGAVNTARGKMGRLAGFLGLLAGGAAILVWVLFQQVMSADVSGAVQHSTGDPTGKAIAEAIVDNVSVQMGMGLHLILLSGILGAVAGLGCLVKPDRPEAATTRVA